ncbi:hypothetical protein [Streptomyces sp. NPDC001880]
MPRACRDAPAPIEALRAQRCRQAAITEAYALRRARFATEEELNSIIQGLQGNGLAEEITEATFERAAVKRWLTSQGHDINEDEVQPQ